MSNIFYTSDGRTIQTNVEHFSATGSGSFNIPTNMVVASTKNNNKLLFSNEWSAFPDDKTDGAEISNDTGLFKTLMLVGNKSAGTNTRNVSVWDKLTVNGQLCVGDKCVDKNSFGANTTADQATAANIKMTRGWTAYPDNRTDAAEISNDTNTFKTLMIVGNKSAGTGTRNVSVWDKLTVNGQFCVGGTCIDENTFRGMINRR
jgi:hypothetical protein